jgi:hypothetical protein
MKSESKPFASVVQMTLIYLLLIGFICITQQWSESIYRFGFILLMLTTFVQIAFGNIASNANFVKSMKTVGVTFLVVILIFGVGIWIAPYLVNMGRGGTS